MGFLTGVIGAVTKGRRGRDFQPWHALILVGVIVVAVVLGLVQRAGEPVIVEPEQQRLPIIINEQTCIDSGGIWNDCGSACRGASEDVPCIALCVEYCECTDDTQCPFGSTCSDFIQDKGICSSDSLSPELSF